MESYDEDIDTLTSFESIWYRGCFITMIINFQIGIIH